LAFLCSSAVAATISSARTSSTKRTTRTQYVRWTTSLRGSHASLLRQNAEIDRLQIPRIEDDAALQDMVAQGELVSIHQTPYLTIDSRLDAGNRYCREWVLLFLSDISRDFYRQFHKQLQVNSAVRTVEEQKRLMRHNRNAAPADGDTASSHLAGITVDLARKGLTRKERKWMTTQLLQMERRGLVEAVEERYQSCYHVMVSSKYSDWRDDQQLANKTPGRAKAN